MAKMRCKADIQLNCAEHVGALLPGVKNGNEFGMRCSIAVRNADQKSQKKWDEQGI